MIAGGTRIMPEQTTRSPPSLYEQDETAWLEQTASLVAQRRFDEIDREHLCEYLSDMARRDKREVFSRMVVLLVHLLKWDHHPDHRSNSWRGTIVTQRSELRQLLESGSLRARCSLRHTKMRWNGQPPKLDSKKPCFQSSVPGRGTR
jgi:hypothetical protein